jgi:uncharacterized protein YqeY
MGLKEQIANDFKQALKQRNEAVVGTLRMVSTAITNAEIAKMREKLTEEEVLKLIKSETKKRKEAILDYRKGGREDLALKEEGELKILEKYLPEQLGEEEISKIVRKVIEEIKPSGPGDFGKVMKVVAAEIGGRADGKTVSEMVKEEIGK